MDMDARSDRRISARSAPPSRFQLATALALSTALLLGAAGNAEAAWNLFPKGDSSQLTRSPDQRLFISIQGGIQTVIIQPSFKGPAAQFGLIVPTPAVPDFSAEVADDFFDQLDAMTAPPLDSAVGPEGYASDAGAAPPPTNPGAKVVEEALIGMYKARVVEAESVDDLVQWLQQNQFAYDTAATDTLRYYVQNRWFFVALEINLQTVSQTGDVSHMQPLVIRFPSENVILPMRMAYLQGSDEFNWTLYLDTSVQVKDAVFRLSGQDKGNVAMPSADYKRDNLPASELGPYQKALSPQVLAGDHLARLTLDLKYADVQGDLVFNLVTTTQAEQVIPGSGSGCSVASGRGRSGAEGAGLVLLGLGMVVAAAARRRSRR